MNNVRSLTNCHGTSKQCHNFVVSNNAISSEHLTCGLCEAPSWPINCGTSPASQLTSWWRLHRRAATPIECVQANQRQSTMAETKKRIPKRITTPIIHPRRARDMKAELDHRGARSSNGDPNNWNTSKIITSRTLNSRRKIYV